MTAHMRPREDESPDSFLLRLEEKCMRRPLENIVYTDPAGFELWIRYAESAKSVEPAMVLKYFWRGMAMDRAMFLDSLGRAMASKPTNK